MAKRISRGSIPLEKQSESIGLTTISTIETDAVVLDFDLLPDEIAEIHIIDSTIWSEETDNAARTVQAGLYMSMDPNVSSLSPSALTVANLEDLEVFFNHRIQFANRTDLGGGAGTGVPTFNNFSLFNNKQLTFPAQHPYLVGTNVGLVLSCVSSTEITDMQCTVNVFFKRRRATAMELNQILLKRR